MSPLLNVTCSGNRLSIAGRVMHSETGRPIVGGNVTITEMPAVFRRKLEARPSGARRLDVAATAHDGWFYFVNLPEGTYRLRVEGPGGPAYFGSLDMEQVVANAEAPLADMQALVLPATGLRGQVVGRSGTKTSDRPLLTARVVARGFESQLCTQWGSDGRFFLTGVEPGPVILVVRASGYSDLTVKTKVIQGKVSELKRFVLKSSS